MDGLSEIKTVGNTDKDADQATGTDGKIIKMEEDWSGRVDEGLRDAKNMIKGGKQVLEPAIELLASLEKGSRLHGDWKSNKRVILGMLGLAVEVGDWSKLNDLLHVISKKRALIKQSCTAMVEKAASLVDETPNLPTKMALIDTLRKVTEGKIYLEVERARLTYKLVRMREGEGNVEEAAKLLLELQVETYGTMDKKEKVELLLEQMRLSLARKDQTRAQIISRKISTKFFADSNTDVQAMKIRFYKMMVEVDVGEGAFLQVSKHYSALYATPKVEADPDMKEETLRNALLYCLLAPYAPDQTAELHRLKQDRNLEKMPDYKHLAEILSGTEMIHWTDELEKKTKLRANTIFDEKFPAGPSNWEMLHTRVAQHNIRVIGKYYNKIFLNRMAELLAWPLDKTEEFLSQAVVDGTVQAKIDRPTGIVNFRPDPTSTATLDDWSRDISTLMDKLNLASHLIQKEEMVHKHLHAHS